MEYLKKAYKWIAAAVTFLFFMVLFVFSNKRTPINTKDAEDKAKHHANAKNEMNAAIEANEHMADHANKAQDLQNRKTKPVDVEDKDLLDHLNRPE